MSNTCQERARGTFQGTPFGCHHLKQLLTARLFVQQRHPRPERIGQYLRFSPHPPRAFPPSPTRGNTGRGRGWLAGCHCETSVAAHEPPDQPASWTTLQFERVVSLCVKVGSWAQGGTLVSSLLGPEVLVTESSSQMPCKPTPETQATTL